MQLKIPCAMAGALFLLAIVSSIRAQQPAEDRKPNAPLAAQSVESGSDKNATLGRTEIAKVDLVPPVHRFWDCENDLLFAGVGAGRALDYASTMNIRRRGINEVFLTNSIVDNHPLFAGIEASATAASIGVSYLFHRTGHHQLERWTSAVHFGVAVGGALRNYALKTPH